MYLGLDLASRLNGWCCGDGRGPIACDAFDLGPCRRADGSHNYGLMLRELGRYLTTLHGRFQFTHLAYEAPILIPRRRGGDGETLPGDTLGKLRLLYPLGAFVEFWALTRGVDYREKTVGAIKAEVTGDQHADKDAMVAAAYRAGVALPPGEEAKDAADAWGVWLLLLRDVDKRASAEWDHRLAGARGRLL